MGWNVHLPQAGWYTLQSPELESIVREVSDQRVIAIDTETTGLTIWKDFPLFWSLCWGNKRICMPASTMDAFRSIFEDETKDWVFANAKYDCHMLANNGFELAGRLIDTAVMHALLYEEQPHGLKDMAAQLLGWKWADFFDTFERKTILADGGARKESIQELLLRIEREDLHTLVEYASNDAFGTMRVYEALLKELESSKTFSLYPEQFDTLADVFFKTEVPFTKVLFNCERNGIRINTEYLHGIQPSIERDIQDIERSIVREAGRLINPNSPKQMQEYFFNERKFRPLKLGKGGKSGVRNPSADAEFLEHYAAEDPVAKLMLQHRDLSKLLTTYVRGLQAKCDPYGRIHTRFNQDIARTGRLSCISSWTEVKTTRGNLPVSELEAGDRVLTHTGKYQEVLCVFTKGVEDMFDVRLSNGEVLTCTAAHKVLTEGGKWIALGEVINECFPALGFQQVEPGSGSSKIPFDGIAYDGNYREGVGDDFSQRLPRNSNVPVGGRAEGSFSSSLLCIEDGCQEPHDGKNGGGPPRVEGPVLGRIRVSDLSAQGQEAIRSQNSDGGSIGSGRASGVNGCTPHRRGQKTQRAGQPSASDQGRTSQYPLFAGEGLPVVTIEKIVYRGRLEVYDLTVKEDASYYACGVFSHNSSEPNLQNIPRPDADKYKMRGTFIPADGHDLIVVDYEQLEMRLLAAAALEPGMIDIFHRNWDIHMGNAALVFGKKFGIDYEDIVAAKKVDKDVTAGKLPPDAMTAHVKNCLYARQAAKSIGFGLNYGMKENKLARGIGCTVEEAKAMIDAYMATYPAVAQFYQEAIQETEVTGYSHTLLGRRRYLPEIMSSREDERWSAQRKAVNTQIQGTAADACRLAMLHCSYSGLEKRLGCKMLLQVHDELVFECPRENLDEAKAIIKDCMEHPFPTDLEVPILVSMGSGKNWLEAK